MQSEISQMIHIFWNMSKNNMFGQLFSEVDQRSALALLANIKPALLKRLPDGLRRGRGCRGMGRGFRMPWPMHHGHGMGFEGMGSDHSFFSHTPMGMHPPSLHGHPHPSMHPPFVPFSDMYGEPQMGMFADVHGYGDSGSEHSSGNKKRDHEPSSKSPSKIDDSDTLFEDFGGVEDENGKDHASGSMEDSHEIIELVTVNLLPFLYNDFTLITV